MLRLVTTCAATAVLAAGATAYASTSHVFGHGGVGYKFDSVCHRTTFVPPGISDREAINVLAQQTQCLVKREKRIRNCYRNAFLSFYADHVRRGHPEGDWLGVDELKKCGSK